MQVEIRGLDIYDPISDTVKARNVEDIAYWMVDDDYDGSNFVVKQVFFCGGDKDEFDKWKRGLSDLSKQATKRNAERTLKIEIWTTKPSTASTATSATRSPPAKGRRSRCGW